jgi:hypothetical protein
MLPVTAALPDHWPTAHTPQLHYNHSFLLLLLLLLLLLR